MIVGHGIDIVEISRFAHWHTYSLRQLSKVFTTQEIRYCLSEPVKSAERFAARFAAKEAAFKAMCQLDSSFSMPFVSFCKATEIVATQAAPVLNLLNFVEINSYKALISLSHNKEHAIASVIIQT